MADTLARILDLPATDLLIGSVVSVTLWAWLFKWAQRALILIPFRVLRNGEVHRLFTAGWVHGDLVHLGLNMFTLHYFAGQTTQVLGTPRFLVLYVTAVVVGFLPTTVRHRRDPGYSSLGASGAVMAVVFSSILLHPKLKFYVLFLPVPVSGALFALAYLAYSLWHSWADGDGVNHEAHAAGALYGSLLAYLFEPARVERSLTGLWNLLKHLG